MFKTHYVKTESHHMIRKVLRRLQRRTYQSQGPNHIWHIDSNHKLVRWNFIVSGGIDLAGR